MAFRSTSPRKVSVFRNLASRFLKTNELRQNPAPNALKIANLDRSTPGGNPPITRKKGLYGQRMSSRHAQRTPLPVARHARQLFLLLPRTPQHPARPREARIEMPDRLDSKGTQVIIHRTLQALAAGHISARRAAVLLYGIQMSFGQAPQIPILQP